MRASAPSGLESADSLRWGTHLCQAFEVAADLERVLVPYFKAGLENNERCLWVTGEPFNADSARFALGAVVPDLVAREAAGQIEIRDISEWYAPEQELRPEVFVAELVDREQAAIQSGYEGLRTNGNCAWVRPEQWGIFQKYEERVQSTVGGRRMICMCSYGPQQTEQSAFLDTLRSHDFVIAGRGIQLRLPDDRIQNADFAAEPTASGGESVTLEDVLISNQLRQRPATPLNYADEKLALETVAQRVADDPSGVLTELVDVALRICSGEAAGVSVLEGNVFRWLGLRGRLAAFEGATTPRNDSPCGICLDRRSAILMREPERIYSWIRDANIKVPEVLLVPLYVIGRSEIGTLWVVGATGLFNAEHERFLIHVATLAALALHMMQAEHRLKRALEREKIVSSEMSHRVKNMYALAASIVRMSSKNARSAKEMSDTVVSRLSALADAHGLARKTSAAGVDLAELLKTILRPYENVVMSGPPIYLNEHALGSLAMVFHELATNAVKYGALSVSDGRLHIGWAEDAGSLSMTWHEQDGPSAKAPETNGFGTALVLRSIAALGGTISTEWRTTGIVATIALPKPAIVAP